MTQEEVSKPRLVEWGMAQRPLPGQAVSGDQGLVAVFRGGLLVAVVDGMGHGDNAAAAAKLAADTLRTHAGESPIALVRSCHEALKETRGAVVTVATFRAAEGVVNWLGVGNVEGILVRADANANPPIETVLLRSGVVGYQLPALLSSVLPVFPGDLLVLTSDGIAADFSKTIDMKHSPQQIADRILTQHFKGTDDAIVVAARYTGNRNE